MENVPAWAAVEDSDPAGPRQIFARLNTERWVRIFKVDVKMVTATVEKVGMP